MPLQYRRSRSGTLQLINIRSPHPALPPVPTTRLLIPVVARVRTSINLFNRTLTQPQDREAAIHALDGMLADRYKELQAITLHRDEAEVLRP